MPRGADGQASEARPLQEARRLMAVVRLLILLACLPWAIAGLATTFFSYPIPASFSTRWGWWSPSVH